MKHSFKIVLLLVAIFLVSQITGLFFVNQSISEVKTVDGETTVGYERTTIGERPDFQTWQSLLYIIIGVSIGTAVILLLAKYKKRRVWKGWFLLAVWLTVSIALGVLMATWLALVTAAAIALWKVYKPDPVIHNLSEILMYSGLAVLLVPLFDPLWASILLLIIAVYDVIAVWKSKHMVEMSKFMMKSKIFAGLMVPKEGEMGRLKTKAMNSSHKKSGGEGGEKSGRSKKSSFAVLGGGDIAFPLLFTGVVMQSLIQSGFSKINAFYLSLPVIFFTTASLLLLFYYTRKKEFYPAIPPLTAGCFVGGGVVWLITLLI